MSNSAIANANMFAPSPRLRRGFATMLLASISSILFVSHAPSAENKAIPGGPAPQGTQGIAPKTPQDSLSTIKVHDGLRVELVAAEPMIESPVAIDFGPDGKVWVAEMRDYGCKDGETCPPMGRVSVLEDRDQDGTFEKSTVFLDKIAQPMGVTVWRDGVLICAAPDILYAKDTDGDGRADDVKKLFTGFSIENPQARLNSLAYDLDGWLQAGCMFVGKISNLDGKEFDLGNRDFKLQPDLLLLEPENGLTENARVRDDWGNWFGTQNSSLCISYPFPDRYLSRSPRVVPPSLLVYTPTPDAARLIPLGKVITLDLSGPVGSATAACGLAFYRDELLGQELTGNAFVCEPVHQLVHRMVLRADGTRFIADRAENEKDSEFLAATDNWFRPVQVRTGPDGALWIVDMYRFVVEHSRWIPQKTQDQLDVYAGNNLGRIYRVIPNGAKSKPLPRFDQLDTQALVAALDSPNGTQRDMVQQQLVWRADTAAAGPLLELLKDSKRPATRIQALWTLELLKSLDDAQLIAALSDDHSGVRRQAVRIAEPLLKSSPQILSAALKLADDPDAFVAQQLAMSLSATSDPAKIGALATLARKHAADDYITTGIMTAVSGDELGQLLKTLFAEPKNVPAALANRLFELAATSESNFTRVIALDLLANSLNHSKPLQLSALDAFLAGLRRRPENEKTLPEPSRIQLQELCKGALSDAIDEEADVKTRIVCIRIVGRAPASLLNSLSDLAGLLTPANDMSLQLAAVDALADSSNTEVADLLLENWSAFTPALRTKVLDVLLSRKPWVHSLLGAIEGKSFAVADVDAAHRARLIEYPDPEIVAKAKACFNANPSGDRAQVVEKYTNELPSGNSVRGQDVFKKNCIACHEVRGLGSRVGPDIAAIKDKSNAGLLREILDPNRAVDGRYSEYIAITNDGRVKNGILVEETASGITLRGQQAEQTSLLRTELESLTSSGKSLMPEGFENQITPQDMADLLEFLAASAQPAASSP